jgi:hypothetical protein
MPKLPMYYNGLWHLKKITLDLTFLRKTKHKQIGIQIITIQYIINNITKKLSQFFFVNKKPPITTLQKACNYWTIQGD